MVDIICANYGYIYIYHVYYYIVLKFLLSVVGLLLLSLLLLLLYVVAMITGAAVRWIPPEPTPYRNIW